MADWDEFNEDCMEFYGQILTGEFRHFCPDWDYLPIDETCYTFEHCLCHFMTWDMDKKRKIIEEMRNESDHNV
jgi:hypothetical protein